MLPTVIRRARKSGRAPRNDPPVLRLVSRFDTMKFTAMPSVHFSGDRPVDYFILVEPRADGAIIGTYNDRPIPDAVKDAFGRRYSYVGVASRLRDGRLDVKTLSEGEWFVHPGLVYRMEADDRGGLLGRFRKRNDRSHGEHVSL
jgi:hypothetical protein